MSLRERMRRKRQAWIADRHPRQPFCTTGIRSIYILPSRGGIAMLFFLAFLFLLAVNYQNALVFGLFFWLVSLAVLNLHVTHHNISGLTLRCVAVRNGVVGESVEFDVEISRNNQHTRHALDLSIEEGDIVHTVSLDETASRTVTLSVPSDARGYVPIPRITLRSVYPLGIAKTWSYAHLAAYAVAYPLAVDSGTPAKAREIPVAGTASSSVPGVTDFESLRAFVPGDRLSRVHWPASSRSGTLQVKQFVDPIAHDEWVRWNDFHVLSTEPRLQHMAFLIEQMEDSRLAYGVELPAGSLSPSVGNSHFHRCREALATHGLREPDFG